MVMDDMAPDGAGPLTKIIADAMVNHLQNMLILIYGKI
jgi:hypothetical protein